MLRAENTNDAFRARTVDAMRSGSVNVADASRHFTNAPGCRKPSSVFRGWFSDATTIACSSNEAFGFMSPLQLLRLAQRIRSVLLYHLLPARQSNRFWMRSFRLKRSMPDVNDVR